MMSAHRGCCFHGATAAWGRVVRNLATLTTAALLLLLRQQQQQQRLPPPPPLTTTATTTTLPATATRLLVLKDMRLRQQQKLMAVQQQQTPGAVRFPQTRPGRNKAAWTFRRSARRWWRRWRRPLTTVTSRPAPHCRI
ncbi:hypothetical protein DQ04_19331000 [Trypanosoma grayi]|uniref:hypothetical protein n=1 Tax=Trypanosoma grayi TaxID=71804 RepID=UPI0004F49765|nr:hypothetical protein DQ04_19331000 [Trypanosoma grayi]KEG05685.1 hypothetical protein DQ04_19331000 [Trypanosoma grayi]